MIGFINTSLYTISLNHNQLTIIHIQSSTKSFFFDCRGLARFSLSLYDWLLFYCEWLLLFEWNLMYDWMRSEFYVTTDGQSVSLSWNKAPIWGLRSYFYYCHTVACLLMWGALSDERTGLSFTIVTVPRQHSHFRVRASWDSWPYFTVWMRSDAKSKSHCEWRSVTQSILPRYLLLFDCYGLVFVGCPL
jgi:hypothetical protein